MSQTPCFGIDLGTSCSAIGWIEDGAPRLLPIDDADNVLLPSVVSFPLGKPPLVGAAAVNSLQLIPERTVVSSKRKIGSDFTYDIEHNGRRVTPVDVAALILTHLTDAAERACGVRPKRVVITVPAWFTQSQRNDTRRAGADAGLEVVRIINEPTAAALTHARHLSTRRRALVYDLGGGTFDVSLIEQDGPVVEVKASHGDTELGGDDVDVIMRDRVLRRLDLKDRDFVDAIAASKPAMLRLKVALEQAKIELSARPATLLTLPFLATVHGQPRHLEMELTSADLDYAAGFVLERTLESVDQVLQDAGFAASDLDALLLVGGSTQLPQVWHLLRDRYGLEGSHAVHPQRAVALGATIQAAIIDGSRTDGLLIDVAPYALSVGVSTGYGEVTHFVSQVLTPRNATLPSRHTEVFSTLSPTQDELSLPVFQGSDPDPRKNVFLGEICMEGLEPAPRGYRQRPISVEFRHDLNGMVDIVVTDELSGRAVSGRVAADGAQQAEQRAAWLSSLFEDGEVIFGDDTMPSWGDIGEDEATVQARQAAFEAAEDADALEDEDGAEGDDASEGAGDDAADSAGVDGAEGGAQAASGSSPELRSELEDARQLFDRILEARQQLLSQHPRQAAQLESLARSGLVALEVGDANLAMEHFDTLSDDMFNLGLYL
jgi:molecular chaperone DnaK